MKKEFSTKWKRSTKVRKQRKYVYNAPLHIRGKFLNAHLSKELIKKYGKRSIRVVKEDKVKIMKGQFHGKIGKISRVDVKNTKVFVENIELIKKDGSKVPYGIHPSNLMIMEPNLGDKLRVKRLEAKK